MKLNNRKYFLGLFLIVFIVSCKQVKYVPKDKFLLKSNKINLHNNGELNTAEMYDVIKQKPNSKFIFKFRLAFFNAVDSSKCADRRHKKNIKLQEKNIKKLDKQDKINARRRARALKRGKEYYRYKEMKLKDTINPKKIFCEWYKYTLGEPPAILDTALARTTDKQLELFLQKKGYYYGEVTDTIIYDSTKQKARVIYDVYPGEPYRIDSIYVDVESAKNTQWGLRAWLSGKSTANHDHTQLGKGEILDSDLLNRERNYMTKYMREQGFYGFYPEHITYELDTFKTTMTANVKIKVKPRLVKSEEYADSIETRDHVIYHVKDVYFHMYETSKIGEVPPLDTIVYTVKEKKRETYDLFFITEKRNLKKNGKERKKRFFVKPKIVSYQTFLEPGHYYKSIYSERTYRRLQALGVFRSVHLTLDEVHDDSLDAHFYLLNAKRQSFKVEPRGTYSNGFIGLSASMVYTNKNLFHGAEKFSLGITGGFESQPTILNDGSKGQLFNTWEIGAAMALEVPGLLPIPYMSFGKRTYPITIYSLSYNHQQRPDFKRDLFQLSYLYKWSPSDPKQLFNSGFPLINNIKYVQIDKSPEFEQRLQELNDLFLLASYSDQFIWEDFRIGWTFNNAGLTRSKVITYFTTSFNTAGYFLEGVTQLDDIVKNSAPDSISTLFGVPFSRFLRFDNELRIYHNFKKGMSMNYRLMAGFGVPDPGIKQQKALPYDYSFYAGGASDNRGWLSRTLGPGSYQYYLDTNATQTQIGDIRLLLSAEYRFDIYSFFKGALFADASNVWTWNNDPNRQGGQFSANFIKEFAINVGVGLRLDFDFFQVRFDLGFPIHNPSMPTGERWIFTKQTQYEALMQDVYGVNWEEERENRRIQKPFVPRFNLGIGYPF